MQPIQLESRVGPDGVLKLDVRMGAAQANSDVVVTILPKTSHENDGLAWRQFVEEMYGSCANTGLERGNQGSYELRESLD